MEATFAGVSDYLGFSAKPEPFLMVPAHGTGLLALRKGEKFHVRASDSRLKLNELSTKEVSPILRDFLYQYRRADDSQDLFKPLWETCQRSIAFGWRIFAVKGKGSGLPHIKATHGRSVLHVDVAICPYKVFKVAFRVLRHKEEAGHMRPASRWSPEGAAQMLGKVNDIFAPQVNIHFKLDDSDWITTEELPQPIGDAAFKHSLLKHKSETADVTVFLVGRWKGNDTHPNGSYYTKEKVAVVDDKPYHPEGTEGDPFALTLAHELAHHVQDSRSLVGHHNREKVLLSNGIQAPKLDKQLVADLNPW